MSIMEDEVERSRARLNLTDHQIDAAWHVSQRMLDLSSSCISRQTFAAQIGYQCLCAEELQMVMSIMENEVEESRACLNLTDRFSTQVDWGRMFSRCSNYETDSDPTDPCYGSDASFIPSPSG
ncbi:hypothetical protein K503DRAFT_610936 [Rhizopogon vinicolor AM-OR11-026]|uniref:Uncharacterized protein n=1 Tax=Rhizopogon vinicolor AM-OR11-026 TaxID=1314800 RepID=A0A1B7NGA3_9AGAM|nr:hypothetical protein K503DRAFT_610936 [Rhizopogon vinicolor AM-OR11-026]